MVTKNKEKEHLETIVRVSLDALKAEEKARGKEEGRLSFFDPEYNPDVYDIKRDELLEEMDVAEDRLNDAVGNGVILTTVGSGVFVFTKKLFDKVSGDKGKLLQLEGKRVYGLGTKEFGKQAKIVRTHFKELQTRLEKKGISSTIKEGRLIFSDTAESRQVVQSYHDELIGGGKARHFETLIFRSAEDAVELQRRAKIAGIDADVDGQNFAIDSQNPNTERFLDENINSKTERLNKVSDSKLAKYKKLYKPQGVEAAKAGLKNPSKLRVLRRLKTLGKGFAAATAVTSGVSVAAAMHDYNTAQAELEDGVRVESLPAEHIGQIAPKDQKYFAIFTEEHAKFKALLLYGAKHGLPGMSKDDCKRYSSALLASEDYILNPAAELDLRKALVDTYDANPELAKRARENAKEIYKKWGEEGKWDAEMIETLEKATGKQGPESNAAKTLAKSGNAVQPESKEEQPTRGNRRAVASRGD